MIEYLEGELVERLGLQNLDLSSGKLDTTKSMMSGNVEEEKKGEEALQPQTVLEKVAE